MWTALAFPFLVTLSNPQDSPVPDSVPDPLSHHAEREYAFELVEQGRVEDALHLLFGVTERTPYDGEAWLKLATCQYRLHAHDLAIDAYEEALALGFGFAPSIHYNIACCHALLGRVDEAFAALDRALARRLENRSQLLGDPDLKTLQEDERWAGVAGLSTAEDLTPAEGWRLDLLFLREEIERLHIDMGQSVPRAELDAAVAELYERIPELPEHRIPVQMQRIVRMLGDGHSVVYPMSKRTRPTQLPFSFYWFPEGLYVIDAGKGLEEWIGSRVLSIGTAPAARFAEDLGALVTRDNPMGVLWMGPLYLTFPAVLQDLGYVDSIDHIALEIEAPDGMTQEVVVEPVGVEWTEQKLVPSKLGPDAPHYLRNVDDNYWFKLLDPGALYVQFNRVLDKRGSQGTLKTFAEEIRTFVTKNEVDHLILDLRHNNGGVSYLCRELLRSLIHFETTRPGKLYVLIGRNTYSAAQILLTDLERLTDAILVGEPSGSRPNMVSEQSDVVLPYSGTRASISCRYFQQSWPGDDRIWIVPDIPVTLTAEDYHEGVDRALEVVLEHVGR